MKLIDAVTHYRDERDKILNHQRQLDELSDEFHQKAQAIKWGSDEFEKLGADYMHEVSTVLAGIAEIETARIVRKAHHWRVPVPTTPFGTEDDNDFWQWHKPHGRHYLSEQGMSALRREIYNEWEMWSKPWLSWGAITISVVSLAVALFKS